MKSAIITGGTGMIGCSLAEHLIKENVEVYVVTRPNSKRINMLPRHPLLKVLECDLDNLGSFNPDGLHAVDAFFHLGWEGTTGEDRNNFYLQNKNVKYTLDAVGLAQRLNCTSFVFAGSQAQFGRVSGLLDGNLPSKPETAYGVGKLCAESMSRLLCNRLNIKHCSARILSIYGPNDGENTLVSYAIRKMLKGEETSFTPCEQKWDYLYCKDAAKALYLIALSGKHDGVYCLGSGKAEELKQYVETIKNIINPSAKVGIGNIPYAPNQVMMLCADITDLKKDVGFEPDYSFDEGILETINWWKNKLL